MAEPRDTSIPGEQARPDPEKGSRGNVNVNQESGATSRPIREEQRDQQDLPASGERKDDTHP